METQYAIFGIGTQETAIIGLILLIGIPFLIYRLVYYKAHYDITSKAAAEKKKSDSAFCSACGAPVPTGAAFCSKCGKPIN